MEFPKEVQGGKQQGRDHWCFLSIPISLPTATLRKERVWINGVLGLGTWKERARGRKPYNQKEQTPVCQGNQAYSKVRKCLRPMHWGLSFNKSQALTGT